MLEPMQVGQWMAFVIDTIKMQFRVPPKKIAKLKCNLNSMVSSGSATFRGLARVVGFINSLCLAVGPTARLFTRQMHATIQARLFWDCSFSLSSPLQEELRFWFANIEAFNGCGIHPKFTPVAVIFSPVAVIFCDASDYAFGGYQIRLNDQPVNGMFSHFESQQSSTFRELSMLSRRMLHLSGTRKLKFSRTTRMPLGLSHLVALSSIFSVKPLIFFSCAW